MPLLYMNGLTVKIIFISLCISCSYFCAAQEIVNAIMANEKGITHDQKKAKYLIIIKKYKDTVYERLNYYFTGPMISRKTYSDSNLSVLNGRCAEYSPSGYLFSDGQYVENKKNGTWMHYDDTSHAILKYTYHLDTLLAVIDLDSLAKEKDKIKEDTTRQFEAEYIGGVKKISQIIQSNMTIPDRMAKVSKGGTARIRFVIDTTGKPEQIEVLTSVEFTFDEESKRVVSLLNDWTPASDKGRKVKAYRIQPITVVLQ